MRYRGVLPTRRISSHRSLLLVVALASFGMMSLGLPDGMQGVAWPSMSAFFGVPLTSLGVLIAVNVSGYVAVSFNSGRVLNHLSPGTLLSGGALVMALGLLGFALVPQWWALLVFAMVAGFGMGGIDAGLNVYAAVRFSARVTNWMHGFYGVGAATGPALMTGILVAGGRWQWGYVTAAGVLVLLVIGFKVTAASWQLSGAGATDLPRPANPASSGSTLRLPGAWLGIASFALYTGLEVTAGQWAFTLLTNERGMDTGAAGSWVAVFYAGLTAGRFGWGLVANMIPSGRLLWTAMAVSALSAGIFWLNVESWLSLAAIAILGLSFGPIFPLLISTTPSRIGRRHTANTIGFQIAAGALGAALLPGAVGLLAGATSLEAVSVALFVGAVAQLGLYGVLVAWQSKER